MGFALLPLIYFFVFAATNVVGSGEVKGSEYFRTRVRTMKDVLAFDFWLRSNGAYLTSSVETRLTPHIGVATYAVKDIKKVNEYITDRQNIFFSFLFSFLTLCWTAFQIGRKNPRCSIQNNLGVWHGNKGKIYHTIKYF